MIRTIATLTLRALCVAISKNIEIESGGLHMGITYSGDSLYTYSLSNIGGQNVFSKKSEEFSLHWDDQYLSGYSGWQWIDEKSETDRKGNLHTYIRLKSTSLALEIMIEYIRYAQHPIIRKRIHFTNTSTKEAKLERLTIQHLQTEFGSTHTWTYTNYGCQKKLGAVEGNWDNAVLCIGWTKTGPWWPATKVLGCSSALHTTALNPMHWK